MISYLAEFFVLAFIQALVINGIYTCFQGQYKDGKYTGNIFYLINPDFFEKHKQDRWVKPLWGCVKCMASFWGAITFFSFVIPVYGFRFEELFIFIADAFCLVSLNFYIYKLL